jgi:hypothetical protein
MSRIEYSPSVPAQQFVILARQRSSDNGMAPIGSRAKIIRDLAQYNTAPEIEGDDVLYGPGIRLELPPGQSEVNQILMTVMEEEIAWLVMMRLAKAFDWKIVDTDSGRELNA